MQTNLVVIDAHELRQLLTEVVQSQLSQLPEPQPEPEHLPELLTKKQTAAYLSVSGTTVDKYAKNGLLDKMKVGPSAVRFRRDDVKQLARTLPM